MQPGQPQNSPSICNFFLPWPSHTLCVVPGPTGKHMGTGMATPSSMLVNWLMVCTCTNETMTYVVSYICWVQSFD